MKKASKKKASKKARVKLKINGYNKANQLERQIDRFMENRAPLDESTAVEYHKLASSLKGYANRLEALALKELGFEVVTVAYLTPTPTKADDD